MIAMQQIKQKLNCTRLCSIIVICWLSALTLVVINATSTIRTMNEKISADEHNPKLPLIELKLAELATQLENSKTNPTVTQSQLTNVQQELRTRIQAISEQQSGLASNSQLDVLKKQLQQLQQELQLLQTAQANKPLAVTVPKAIPAAKTATSLKTNPNQPPFNILSVELRGGERVLSIIPTASRTIATALLLTTGQALDNWQLESIDEQTAVFKVNGKIHRLTIPKP